MITGLFAGLLAILNNIIAFFVIKQRRSAKVAFGHNDDKDLIHLTSAHNNFASYTPLYLILSLIAEIQRFNIALIISVSAIFVIGRAMHFISMKNGIKGLNIRPIAMILTLIPITIMAVVDIYIFIMTYLLL